MSFQQLYDVLLSVNADKNSGKVYVYIKENSSRHTGIILVGNGEVLGISYSQKTGKDALNEMLSLNIENSIFMPRSDLERNDRKSDTPTVLDVLQALQDKLLPGSSSKKASLRQEVEEFLKKIYGPGIIKEIDRIASAYPPDQNPHGFLDQCKLKAMLMLNKDKVEKIFNPLYEKIKKAG